MDKIIYSLKKNKLKNYNALFVKINTEQFNFGNEELDKLVNEYKKYIIDNKDIRIIIDARMVSSVNRKMVWENIHKINFSTNINKNIKCQSIILNNKLFKNLINTITKIHPFLVKTAIVDDNSSAIKFIESC